MKKFILYALMLTGLSGVTFGQTKKYQSYTASNKITYHVGDTIKLGIGSAGNGDFKHLKMAGWGGVLNSSEYRDDENNIPQHYSGTGVVIKKIRSYTTKGVEKVTFSVGAGNITNYELYIEEAIAACEVADCKKSTPVSTESKYDKLKKLKDLLDSGAITQAEYDKEKEKVLAETP